jgi:hypothetical protein
LPSPEKALVPALPIRAVRRNEHHGSIIPLGDAPDDMNRLTQSVLLQDEETRTSRIIRVGFDDDRAADPGERLACRQAVLRQLIVPMLGDSNFSGFDERHDRL